MSLSAATFSEVTIHLLPVVQTQWEQNIVRKPQPLCRLRMVVEIKSRLVGTMCKIMESWVSSPVQLPDSVGFKSQAWSDLTGLWRSPVRSDLRRLVSTKQGKSTARSTLRRQWSTSAATVSSLCARAVCLRSTTATSFRFLTKSLPSFGRTSLTCEALWTPREPL